MTYSEALIHALIIEAKAVEVSVEGMKAHDRNCESQYTEEAYLSCVNRLEQIAKEIKERAAGL
jgi:hypothetical protein